MQFKNVNFVAPAQCPYTIEGRKLIEIRKAVLAPHAAALGIAVTPELGKSDMVRQMIERLDASGAPFELTELKKKPAPKKKK